MPPLDGKYTRLEEQKALRQLFRGHSAKSVADEIGIGQIVVSRLLRQFINEGEEFGDLMSVAKKYGVGEQVVRLISVSRLIEETGIDVSEAIDGLNLIQSIKPFGIDPTVAADFINLVYKEAVAQKLSPETFVKVVSRLHELGIEKYGDLSALQGEIERKMNLVETLEKQVSEQQVKATESGRLLEKALREKEATLSELNKFIALRDRLMRFSLDLDDLDKAVSCLVNVAELGGDPVSVVSLYSKGVGLRKQIEVQEETAAALSRQNEALKIKLDEANRLLESKKELVWEVSEAERLGLKPSQLGALVEATLEAGSRHGLGKGESINKLVKDLNVNRGTNLVFEDDKTEVIREINRIKERVNQADSKEKMIDDRVKIIEENLSEFEELRKHVSADEISALKELIDDSGLDLSAFRREVRGLGSFVDEVRSIRERREAELVELGKKVDQTKSQVDQILEVREKLEDQSEDIKNEAMKQIQIASKELRGAAEDLKRFHQDQETGIKPMSLRGVELKREVDEFEVKKESLGHDLETLNGILKKSLDDIERLQQKTYDLVMLVGFRIQMESLAKIIAGVKLERLEALDTMKNTVKAFRLKLYNDGLYDLADKAERFRIELSAVT